MIQVFWKDLTAEKQEEIINEFGDNCNFDTIPLVELWLDEEIESSETDDEEEDEEEE